MRTSEKERKTKETEIKLFLCLDGKGKANIDTGCGFLNHMLELFAKHSHYDLDVVCKGDKEVDFHHTTEDIAICLGKCFCEALGDKKGINRYADRTIPMDEALVMCAVDISGRSYLSCKLDIPTPKVGDFDTELCEEFLRAFVREADITLHIRQLDGYNSHHIIECVFKALARTLSDATYINEKYENDIPSTKGVI